jgi:hypothetical protein
VAGRDVQVSLQAGRAGAGFEGKFSMENLFSFSMENFMEKENVLHKIDFPWKIFH